MCDLCFITLLLPEDLGCLGKKVSDLPRSLGITQLAGKLFGLKSFGSRRSETNILNESGFEGKRFSRQRATENEGKILLNDDQIQMNV